MRKRFLFLFVLLLSLAISQATAQERQKETIQLTFDNEEWSDALKKVGKAFGYKILFTYDDVKNRKATCSIKTTSVGEAIKAIIGNEPFTYTQNGNFISIISTDNKKRQANAYGHGAGHR